MANMGSTRCLWKTTSRRCVGPEGIKVAILGIGNHRIPNYELPSNIPGLTFSNPLAKAQELADQLSPTNDVVVALTHIGFAENPSSVEVDTNVDVNMAMTVSGLDTIIGGHSHTNPATGFGAYKYLPTIIASPDNTPVTVTQAYRYNNYLGSIVTRRPPGRKRRMGSGQQYRALYQHNQGHARKTRRSTASSSLMSTC